MPEAVIPRQLAEMSVVIKRPGLVVARSNGIEQAVPGQVYPVTPRMVFQAEEGLPPATLKPQPRRFPWGAEAEVIRDRRDTLLEDRHGSQKSDWEGKELYRLVFGDRGRPRQAAIGEPETVELQLLGDPYRGIIGNVIERRESGDYGFDAIIPLTEDSSIIATSPVINTRLFDPYKGHAGDEVKLMLGASVREGHNGYVGGDVFIALQKPGEDPDINWSKRIDLISLWYPKKNQQALTNFAEFMALLQTLTPEKISELGFNHDTIGPHNFIVSFEHYVSDAFEHQFVEDYLAYFPNAPVYPRRLAEFPKSLPPADVEEQRKRLLDIIVTKKAKPAQQ